jgi:hypothetical protein
MLTFIVGGKLCKCSILSIGARLLGHMEMSLQLQNFAIAFERESYDKSDEHTASGFSAQAYYYASKLQL